MSTMNRTDAERVANALKYIKNVAMNYQKCDDLKGLQHALWRINNFASNTLDLPYNEEAKYDE